MRDEFLFNCEKEIMEANLSLMCGQKEDGLKKIKKVSDDIMQEIGNSIHPFTTNTLPYVIAALRVLANKLEEKTNGEWERTIKGAEKLMNTIDVIQKRRRGTNMQEKLLNTIILAMEMKKICKDNSKLPALVLENASIEAAKDINNYVTPCSNITAPITVAALRYVADIIEKELLDVEQAEIAKMTQETLHESTKVTKEEKRDE